MPSFGNGRLRRHEIRQFLADRFPDASEKSVEGCAQAVCDAFRASEIAAIDRVQISFEYRDIPIPAFAFILHSEFPEPGMYDIAMVENSSTIGTMLWNPSRILPSLYELRNMGILSKVSVIDNVRQFTTKWSLERVVEHLVSREKG